MYAYRLAYDGRDYYGFQRQPDVPTIEGVLFEALRDLDVLAEDEIPSGYACAGRTDAGVSARCQTISFEAPQWLSPVAFNSELPADVRVWARTAVAADFNATHDATRREYTYFLTREGLETSLVRSALDTLSGTQDFHNLTPDETGTERTIATTVDIEEEWFVLTVAASGFPRHFVRRLVSLVASVGRGDRPLADVERILAPEPVSGPEGVGPARPEPLVLTHVSYPDVSFRPDEKALESVRTIFERRRRRRRTAARVASVLARCDETPGR